MAKTIQPGDNVLVTTAHKGVFFGTLVQKGDDRVVLSAARCCVYWPEVVKGFLGLAVVGPLKGSRVGPEVSIMELSDVTSLVLCGKEAVALWKQGPWSS